MRNCTGSGFCNNDDDDDEGGGFVDDAKLRNGIICQDKARRWSWSQTPTRERRQIAMDGDRMALEPGAPFTPGGPLDISAVRHLIQRGTVAKKPSRLLYPET